MGVIDNGKGRYDGQKKYSKQAQVELSALRRPFLVPEDAEVDESLVRVFQ